MGQHELLFRKADLGDILDNLAQKALAFISALSATEVDPSNEVNLLEKLHHQFVVNSIRLHRDRMTREGPREVEIELSGGRAFLYGGEHVRVRGIEVTFAMPFDGDAWLFKCRPNSWTTVFPEGRIVDQEYRLTISDTEKNADRMEQTLDRQLRQVQDYVQRQENQIKAYNQKISTAMKNAIEQRRRELNAIDAFAGAFKVPERKPEPPPSPQLITSESERKSQLKSESEKRRQQRPRVFICYAKQDADNAENIFDALEAAGAEPWLDRKKLVHGDVWEDEIKKAVAEAHAFVACLRSGFDEIGFRQQEVRWAIEALQRRPPGKGFIIPFIIEPCDLPDWCKPFHAGSDRSKRTTIEELIRAIEKHCSWTRRSS